MRPITVTVGPLVAASANNIALSQTPGAAGNLTLNGSLVSGGVATLDTPRRVLITTGDTTHIFTITGTDVTGQVRSESSLVSATYQSVIDYATVTSVSINGAATAAVTVGTNGVASSAWVRLDSWAAPQVGIGCDASGTVNYTIQETFDDPNSPTNPVTPTAVTWVSSADTNAVGASSSIQTFFPYAPTFARVLLNSGTGSVTATFAQYGNATF